MNTETDIISGLKSGDEKAYKYLYDYHYSILCSVACKYVNDYDAAEMIVSDIIYALWKNKSDLCINQTLRGYLLKAVKNSSLNYLNNQSKLISIDLLEEDFSCSGEDKEAEPLLKLIEQELDIKIQKSIESLPELTREIFILSRFENMRYSEIAEQLNISVDVVKYHIKSALKKLRKELKSFYILILLLFLS